MLIAADWSGSRRLGFGFQAKAMYRRLADVAGFWEVGADGFGKGADSMNCKAVDDECREFAVGDQCRGSAPAAQMDCV